MATWIFILHMLVPLSGGLQAAQAAHWTVDAPVVTDAAVGVDAADGPRYRGLERMFAKFESEA
jgi:hypothetical protein